MNIYRQSLYSTSQTSLPTKSCDEYRFKLFLWMVCVSVCVDGCILRPTFDLAFPYFGHSTFMIDTFFQSLIIFGKNNHYPLVQLNKTRDFVAKLSITNVSMTDSNTPTIFVRLNRHEKDMLHSYPIVFSWLLQELD